ncbi:MAG: regulatory protein RecX [Chloroflexi bacterium]|nr:regulatory protein RecX [Chloroflexota bacterium]
MQGEVTALKADRKGRPRVHVFLDGAWALSLSAAVAAGLHVGQRLAPEEVEKLQRQESLQAATHQALRLISRRPRSESELRQGWERRGVAPEVQQAALEHLRQSRQVDDAAFAATWVENREAFRPRSARALRSELRRKGVAEEAITSAVEGVDESDAAYRAAQRFARRAEGLAEEEFIRRVSGQLARRGFDWETIRAAVRRVWTEQGTN